MLGNLLSLSNIFGEAGSTILQNLGGFCGSYYIDMKAKIQCLNGVYFTEGRWSAVTTSAHSGFNVVVGLIVRTDFSKDMNIGINMGSILIASIYQIQCEWIKKR